MNTYKLPNPRLEYLNKDNKFLLLEQYVTPEIIVAKDFVTDGVSSPWFARGLFPRYDKTLPAAIIHDWCYGGYMSRKNADLLFKKNLRRLGISAIRAYVMYLSVRLGGRSHYVRRQKEGPQPNAIDNVFSSPALDGFEKP